MIGLLFGAVVLVAAAVWLSRGMRARSARARARRGPGTTLASAIVVRSFDEIDSAAGSRLCHCKAHLRTVGEGTHEVGGRRYRSARLACDTCEENFVLFFDVTEVRH